MRAVQYTKGNGWYRLLADYNHPLPFPCPNFGAPLFSVDGGVLVVRRNYVWDGASKPAINTKSIIRGSLVHDVFYDALRRGLLEQEFKKPADREFQRICREDGMMTLRSRWVHWGVHRFGGRHAAERIQPVFFAGIDAEKLRAQEYAT